MKELTIIRKEYVSNVLTYKLVIDEEYARKMEKLLKNNYTFNKDFHLTVENICYAYRNPFDVVEFEGIEGTCKEGYGVFKATIPLGRLVEDWVYNDIIDTYEEGDSDVEDVEERIMDEEGEHWYGK